MDSILNVQFRINILNKISDWFLGNVLVLGNVVQVIIIIVLLLLSNLLGKRFLPRIPARIDSFIQRNILLRNLFNSFIKLLPAIYGLILLGISGLLTRQLGTVPVIINLVSTLLLAWVVIKLATTVILDPFWSRNIAIAAWSLAALNVLGILKPTAAFLDSLGFTIGEVHLTVLSLLKAFIFLFLALRFGRWLGEYIEKRLIKVRGLSASTHVLFSKVVKITVYVIVTMIALSSVGIDLTAFAFFSGALGVGIGFGLQRIVSNFISGIILLTDRSIKPGDVVQVGNVYGWISGLRGRYASVVTRDGHEYLIPNEDLITQQVINWSYTDRKVRLNIPIGISYKSDIHKAMELVLEATGEVERVLKYPESLCQLTGFGNSSVDLDLFFWIDDPKEGLGNVKSEVLVKVWDKFHEHGIEIPFPQRDVHVDASQPLPISMVKKGLEA
ncbi:MAG: mechanosensitive ion channel [Fidelibacterota bacterium]|nr:MAG: mechanosensitive ion channel [Candidatus Neomarinimicrobiota bacterium]